MGNPFRMLVCLYGYHVDHTVLSCTPKRESGTRRARFNVRWHLYFSGWWREGSESRQGAHHSFFVVSSPHMTFTLSLSRLSLIWQIFRIGISDTSYDILSFILSCRVIGYLRTSPDEEKRNLCLLPHNPSLYTLSSRFRFVSWSLVQSCHAYYLFIDYYGIQ